GFGVPPEGGVVNKVADRLVVLVAAVLEKLIVGIEPPRIRRLPRPGDHYRILDADLVVDRVLAGAPQALDDAQRFARGHGVAAGTDDRHRRFAVDRKSVG